MYNQVVRYYQYPRIFLLAVFDKFGNEINVDGPEFQYFEKPTTVKIHSIDEAIAYIKKQEKDDKTFEGLVLKDKHGNRMKVKSESYLILHRSANNGNIVNIKNIVPIILDGETDEILAYFPQLKSRFDEISAKINTIKGEISKTWDKYKKITNKKEFALNVIRETKYSAPLFAAFDNKTCPLSEIKQTFLIKHIENM
jgi:hypothetical protein